MFRHLLVPIDFGEASKNALGLALEIAETFGAKLTLVHAYDAPAPYSEGPHWPLDLLEAEAQRALDDVCADAKARCPHVATVLGCGPAWNLTLNVARERGADLIIMGTHGQRGASRALLGSQAERVVRLSPVPVLTVPEGGKRRARGLSPDASTATPTA